MEERFTERGRVVACRGDGKGKLRADDRSEARWGDKAHPHGESRGEDEEEEVEESREDVDEDVEDVEHGGRRRGKLSRVVAVESERLTLTRHCFSHATSSSSSPDFPASAYCAPPAPLVAHYLVLPYSYVMYNNCHFSLFATNALPQARVHAPGRQSITVRR